MSEIFSSKEIKNDTSKNIQRSLTQPCHKTIRPISLCNPSNSISLSNLQISQCCTNVSNEFLNHRKLQNDTNLNFDNLQINQNIVPIYSDPKSQDSIHSKSIHPYKPDSFSSM